MEAGITHAIFALLAIATFLLVGRFDYNRLAAPLSRLHPIGWLMALAIMTCTIVLIPHVGIEVNYSRRWLPLGMCQIQPSELAKWAVVLFLAWILATRPIDLNRLQNLLVILVPIAVLCLLVVIQ